MVVMLLKIHNIVDFVIWIEMAFEFIMDYMYDLDGLLVEGSML